MQASRRRTAVLVAWWGPCLVGWAGLAFWLVQFPPTLSSDDALYFSRALTRFSILDYAPHFPGYPVFVGIARIVHLLVADPVDALLWTTTCVALALPPMAAFVAWRWTGETASAGAAFLLTLSQPVLAALALSGLSDGAGLLFYLLFLALLAPARGYGRTGLKPGISLPWAIGAGIALGLAAWARPSYGVMFLASFLVLLRTPTVAIAVLCGAGLVTLPAAFVLWAAEGWGYIAEGRRFLEGHLFIWGNTAFASAEESAGWQDVAAYYPAIAVLLLLYGVAVASGLRNDRVMLSKQAAQVAFPVMVLWTAVMQNPENLRHLAPLLILGGLAVATLPGSAVLRNITVLVCLALNLVLLMQTTQLRPGPAPIYSAAKAMNACSPEAFLLTNRAADLLRHHLDRARVYTLAEYGAATAAMSGSDLPVYRLCAAHRPDATNGTVFPARFMGEQTVIVEPAVGRDGAPAPLDRLKSCWQTKSG